MLKSSAPAEVKQEDPLEYYAKQTAQIEVSLFRNSIIPLYLNTTTFCRVLCTQKSIFMAIALYQIVREDRSMEQIVYPVHLICEYLTEESKVRVFNTTELDEQGSKVTNFFKQTSFLHNEMKWQKKLRSMC